MPPINYKTRQAAQFLGVHENTVRLWCPQFAAHLSSGANPPKGSARTLTADDLAVLAMVRDGRASNKSLQALDIELAQTSRADMPPAGAIVDAPEATGRTESALSIVQGLDALPALIVAQLQPLLDDAYERGRAEARRRVPPEYVLIVALVCLVALTIASMALMGR